MTPYCERFKKGSIVRVAPLDDLLEFQRTWRLHDPLSNDQLAFAGRLTTVVGVGFYHGGDVLYQLAEAPGVWHERCVQEAVDGAA